MNGHNQKVRALFLSLLMVLSVFAGTAAFAGSAAAAQPSGTTELTSNSTYFQGQQLWNDSAQIGNNEVLEIRRESDDTLVTQIQATGTGNVTIDSSTLDEGRYYLEDDTNTVVVDNFEIVEQSLSSSLDVSSVNNAGDSTTATITYSSARALYNASISVTNPDGDALSADAVENLTTVSGVKKDVDGDSEDEFIVTGGDASVDLNFSGEGAGEYTVDVSVTDTTASASQTVNVQELGDAAVSLTDDTKIVRVAQGDIAAFDIDFTNTDKAYVRIGGSGDGYFLNVSVTDGDDDGSATLYFNTFTAGANRGGNVVSVSSGDSFSVDDEGNLPAILAQGDYSVSLSKFDFATAQDNPEVVGTVFLQDRETSGMMTWTAPSGLSGSDALAAVTEDDTIATSDTLVFEVGASGLEGLVEKEGGFQQALQSANLSMSIVQTENIGKNKAPKEFNLSQAISNGDVSFVSDAQNDTYYVVLDADAQVFQRGGTGSFVAAEAGDEYEATFTVETASGLVDEDESVATSYALETGTAALDTNDAGEIQVESAAGQTITGTSTWAPGTDVTVRVQSLDPENPFIDRKDATIADDGTFSTEWDFSTLPANTNLSISLQKGGSSLETVDGMILGPAAFSPSIASAPSSVTAGESVTVEVDVANTGGASGTSTVSLQLDGQEVDSTEVTVDAGSSSTVTLTFSTEGVEAGEHTLSVVAGEGSAEQTLTVSAATTTATTAPPTTTTTEQPTTEQPTTEATTEQPTTEQPTTEETTAGAEETTTQEDQPGFGVAIALVALVAAALLAVRRRD